MKIKHDCATNACPANGHNVNILKYEELIEDMLEVLEEILPHFHDCEYSYCDDDNLCPICSILTKIEGE